MNYKDFEPNLVRVNQGTGILVPALSEEYCYVFTAKHNVIAEENRITSADSSLDLTIRSDKCFSSENTDSTVIVLDAVASPPLAVASDLTRHALEITFAGFPAVRQQAGDPDRYFDGQITRAEENRFQIFCREFPAQGEVSGMSGGGIFAKLGQEWVLIGIEFGMAGEPEENNTQINCCPITVFEEILNANGLPPCCPPFFDSFQKLCEWSFPLDGTFFDGSKREILSKIMRGYAKAHINNASVTPNSLHLKLSADLFVKNTPPHCANHRKLWVSWLELMAISVLVDKKSADEFDMEYIAELRRKRRLLYSDSTADWAKILRDIIETVDTEVEGLDDGAIIFISNNCAAPPQKFELDLTKLPKDISRVRSTFFDFTKSEQPAKPSRLVHLDGLHFQCINNQEERFDCVDARQTINEIRDEYAANIVKPDR
jgi:hypothetical protein